MKPILLISALALVLLSGCSPRAPRFLGWNAAWSRADLGAVRGTPAIISTGAGQYELFYALAEPPNSATCRLRQATGDGDHWTASEDLGGGFRCQSPAAVLSQGRVVIAAVKDADGSTWTRTRSGSGWYDWANPAPQDHRLRRQLVERR